MNEKKCDVCPIGNYIQSTFYTIDGVDAQCHFCEVEWFKENLIVFDCLNCPKNELNVHTHSKCPLFIEGKCVNIKSFKKNLK